MARKCEICIKMTGKNLTFTRRNSSTENKNSSKMVRMEIINGKIVKLLISLRLNELNANKMHFKISLVVDNTLCCKLQG